MELALEQAKLAATLGEVPIGAVVVKNDELISVAHNEVELRKDASAHAEMLAMQRAAAQIKNWRLKDCSLFVTLEPCSMCAGTMVLSRLKDVYFGCYDPRQGAVGSLFNLLHQPQLPHRVDVFPEVMKERCAAVLQEFFKSVRERE